MQLDLSGRHALVCGASQGIGRASAIELAQLGANVTLLARSTDTLKTVAGKLPRTHAGQQHDWRSVDMLDTASLQTITGEWADSPFDAFTEPDMYLVPDYSTATAAPWTADVTLQVIHDAVDQSGNPVPFSPRNVLKRVLALYDAQGWTPVVAPEMEFFLTARNIDPNMPVEPPMGRSGRKAAGKQAYSLSAIDEYGKVIDDIYEAWGRVRQTGLTMIVIEQYVERALAFADTALVLRRGQILWSGAATGATEHIVHGYLGNDTPPLAV